MASEKRLDLIDRQALGIGRCNPDAFPVQNRGYCAGWNGVINLIVQAPTVDAVEVVRCKDCKWCRYSKVHDVQWCDHESGLCDAIVGNEYCSYGERRTDV